MPDDNNDDEDNLNVELSTKKNDQSHKKTADKPGKNLEASDHSKKAETEKENQKDISVVKVDEDEKKTNSDGEGKQAEDNVAKEDKDKDNDEDEDEDSDKDDDDKSSKDSGKQTRKNNYISFTVYLKSILMTIIDLYWSRKSSKLCVDMYI
jgi:preprotein translocase subunit SecF